MGVHENISFDKFPRQSLWLGRKVDVCFHYEGVPSLKGEIVRDDRQEPFETIIRLEDGRFIKSTECHYSVLPEKP